MFLESPVAVVCHDAGAANLIIGWLRQNQDIDLRVHMTGPALSLWKEAFPDSTVMCLDDALDGAKKLLSGSGWMSNLEHVARSRARANDIPTIAVIDHWVNYRERFIREGCEVLPDEIWVSDDYAFSEAKRCFPEIVLRQFTNQYLQTLVNEIHVLQADQKFRDIQHVLYALEPIRLLWSGDDSRPGEFQALDYFISRLELLGLKSDAQIRLRPHPSDALDKYDSWINSHRQQYNISLAANESVSHAISWADWVVGCESFMLVIALSAGKKVVSTLPPWANTCRLPHKNLIHLSRLK